MALLSTHLSSAGRRARRIFSQRAQAAVLSVALVLSATFPAGVAVGQERDQGQEGIAAPDQTVPPDTSAEPDFDPGGETALPFEVGVPGDGGEDDSGDGAPVDVEPVIDPEAPPVAVDEPTVVAPDAPDGTDEPTPPAEPAPPTEPSQSVPPPIPAPTPAPPPAVTMTPPVHADQPTATDRPDADRARRNRAPKRPRDRTHQRPVVRFTIPAATLAAEPAPVATTAAEPAETAPTIKPSARVRSDQRVHRVQRGESLWTIASDLLGSGATNAEIVAESNHLYRLNRDRIGSDPNVLIAGTVLRLR